MDEVVLTIVPMNALHLVGGSGSMQALTWPSLEQSASGNATEKTVVSPAQYEAATSFIPQPPLCLAAAKKKIAEKTSPAVQENLPKHVVATEAERDLAGDRLCSRRCAVFRDDKISMWRNAPR